jgi:hypothetical protein
MSREILRFPYSLAELVLLKCSNDHYQIDIFWRARGYYERLLEASDVHIAQAMFFRAAREIAIYNFSLSSLTKMLLLFPFNSR